MEQQRSASDHYERGCELKKNQMFDEALKQFQQAASDPQHTGRAYLQMALCLKATDRGEAAVGAFRQAMAWGTFSSKDTAHILYLQGQTLESLGRYAEALEAYGWSRKEDPNFHDVTQRIKHLISRGRGPAPRSRPASRSLVGDLLRLGQQLTPSVLCLLAQAWKSFSQYADRLGTNRWSTRPGHSFRAVGHQSGHREFTQTRGGPPASRDRRRDKRQHVRVAVRLRSHFSSKSRTVAGEGVLRDLSPGGCRVMSSVAVPVGAELEFCIFPQDSVNPFSVEGATVRWSRPQEFGLAFTKVRPNVQRQIAHLCGLHLPFPHPA